MKLAEGQSRKEVSITIGIWASLLVLAIVVILLLKYNAESILERLYYVNVGRGAKANVLYAEAEKNARLVLGKAEKLNKESSSKVPLPQSDKNFQKAITLFNQAFEWDARPEFSPERAGYYDLLAQVQDAGGDNSGQLLSAARSFMSLGNYIDAKDYVGKATTASRQSDSVVLLAQIHLLEGKTSDALASLKDLTVQQRSPKAYWVEGSAYFRFGELSSAATSFAKAVEAAPQNLTFRRDYAAALKMSGQTNKATSIMQAGLDDGGWLDPAYLHTYGEFLVDLGDLAEAIRVLKQADDLAPYSGDIQWSLARAYHKAGKAGLAASALRRATEVKPELHNVVFSEK